MLHSRVFSFCTPVYHFCIVVYIYVSNLDHICVYVRTFVFVALDFVPICGTSLYISLDSVLLVYDFSCNICILSFLTGFLYLDIVQSSYFILVHLFS